MCDWLATGMGEWRWDVVRRCLEVGAGRGLLLQALAARFPRTSFLGVEPSRHGVRAALADGVDMRQGTTASIAEGEFDAVYSIATVEHVDSPTAFLLDIRRKLRHGGVLFLVQPTWTCPHGHYVYACSTAFFSNRLLTSADLQKLVVLESRSAKHSRIAECVDQLSLFFGAGI